tara:strand:- start:1892 stop:2128 length:237 start_codon:yes stop_codon:yes gene_type:complete
MESGKDSFSFYKFSINAMDYKFEGHLHKTIINNVLADQYLTAMCVEDYLSSMSEKELDEWIKTFIQTGKIKTNDKKND